MLDAHSLLTGLKIPSGCELVVGGEPQCWAEGHCLLVDDSFLHTVAHNGKRAGFCWGGDQMAEELLSQGHHSGAAQLFPSRKGHLPSLPGDCMGCGCQRRTMS